LFFIFVFTFLRSAGGELVEVRLDVSNVLLAPIFFISRLLVCICNGSVTKVLSFVNLTEVLGHVALNFFLVSITLVVIKEIISGVRGLITGNLAITVVVIHVNFTILEVKFTLRDLTLGIFIW
jgi:hypothetical protein